MTKTRIAVVGCCNAERFRVPVFPSAQAMLLETRPDVVIIGTLPHTHAEVCLQALKAGRRNE